MVPEGVIVSLVQSLADTLASLKHLIAIVSARQLQKIFSLVDSPTCASVVDHVGGAVLHGRHPFVSHG